jgi:cytochrome c
MSCKFHTWVVVCAVSVSAFAIVTLAQSPAADKNGHDLFDKRCSGCHALDSAKEGPPLRHVFAQHAGNDPKFQYSEALKKSKITWDAASLDRWLADPDVLVPDNDMPFRLGSAEERAAIIAYLKEVAGK